MVGVIVGQRPVVGGKKRQGQRVRGQSMQDSLLCQTIVGMVQEAEVVSYPSDRHSILERYYYQESISRKVRLTYVEVPLPSSAKYSLIMLSSANPILTHRQESQTISVLRLA